MLVLCKIMKFIEFVICIVVNYEGLKSLLLVKDGLVGFINIIENVFWKKDINLSEDIVFLELMIFFEFKG